MSGLRNALLSASHTSGRVRRTFSGLSELKYNKIYFKRLMKKNLGLFDELLSRPYFDYAKEKYRHDLGSKPTSAGVEINNSCNINCLMCDTKSSSRKKQLMGLETVERTVGELKKNGINSVVLHTIGDPLANAQLPAVLDIFRRHKLPIGFLSTNGLMLDKHVEALREYKDVVNKIRFSIDGATPDVYEKIRAGGKWTKLHENLELAKNRLLPAGFEFYIDLVLTRDNFSQMGDMLTVFRKYVYSIQNIRFHFMNSLAPSNSYFLLANTMEPHTHQNSFCKSVSKSAPTILADGRISVCVRDYDGSLVIGDIRSNDGLSLSSASLQLEELRRYTEQADSIDEKYSLCNSCFVIDSRVSEIWINTGELIKHKFPAVSAELYQSNFERLFKCLHETNKFEYQNFVQELLEKK